MISMQRSLSSPVRIRSEAPASPTVTHLSRSPTPPPDTSRTSHGDTSRPRRLPSPSPSRASSNIMSLPVRRSEDSPRRPSSHQASNSFSSRKPIIAQSTLPPASSTSERTADSADRNQVADRDSSAAADQSTVSPRQPLIQDASLYSNPHLTPEVECDTTSLDELAHLVRLSKYQERKRANSRVRLQRTLVATALSARLTRCGDIVERSLAECFRNGDKRTFGSLYNAIQDVQRSCDDTRKYALLDPEMEGLRPPRIGSSESLDTPTGSISATNPLVGSVIPFLNDISASARETFLHFLTQIRNNPDYLATRICSLNTAELTALTVFHHDLEPVESVLPSYGRPSGRAPGPVSSRNSTLAVERLLSFQRHDPLSALIHTCFANSAGPDSAEDKRRTEIWANACARLISESSSESKFWVVISVLNAWSAMRDWSGRSNMEWYLMKILEDGAYILDRAEDQHGTRFNVSDWTPDQMAAEEFYQRATEDLFAVLDDEDGTGIPDGLIEMGNQILKRLDHRYGDNTRRWFVYKWLFSVWLQGVVIHPESHGMMAEYHITPYGRQKILKQVATHAQNIVAKMLWSNKPVSAPPKIKAHIDNILGRFKSSRSRARPRLLPARSITSLRETAEVHPYLVVSPADLATLVNALFPERRPLSSRSSNVRSGAPSISGMSAISQPMSMITSQSNFETASVLSTSVSSAVSDTTTSREPLLEQQMTGASARSSPPVPDQMSQSRGNHYEDDGYRLRLALHEMSQNLGIEAVRGTCHPCAERWAVLFISADGNTLSTNMTYDPDDDPEEENSSSLTDTDEDDDAEDSRPDLNKDYHQLRDSILKLVEDFEIPQSLEPDKGKQTFSNRAHGLKKYRSKNKVITTEKTMASRNPYRAKVEAEQRTRTSTDDTSVGDPSSPRSPTESKAPTEAVEERAEPTPVLVTMLTAASAQSRAQSDFVSAHLYWRTLQQLNTLSSASLRANGFSTLLHIFSRGPRDSIHRSASAIEEYDAWLVWLKQSQERADGLIESMLRRLRALRDKMWYVTDVCNSAPYEHSRNIAVALKAMGTPRKADKYQRTRGRGERPPASNFVYRSESQIVDLLAASEDHGGPNKLSDDQAEKTSRFLSQYGIENFCKGEERIHRFCCEIEACIGKLVGETMMDGPVLWSSELYLRDKVQYDGGPTRRDRDSAAFPDDASSIISDPERRFTPVSSRPSSIVRDLRSVSGYNMSQQSLDSVRYSFSRASTVLSDVFDGSDYFGVSSPVPTIDTATTYWSPFQSAISPSAATSRAHSPTTSVTNLTGSFSGHAHHHRPSSHSHQAAVRPSTAVSLSESVIQQRLNEEKTRFLDDLRRTLTSLLLSDLGNIVFSRGSETDTWFGELGQDCIDRRVASERKARQALRAEKKRSAKRDLKQRVIEKKKSFGDLRGAGSGPDSSPSLSEAQNLDVPSTSKTNGSSSLSNDSSATSDTISARTLPTRKKEPASDFPFTKTYQRLLQMFCVHPNPYIKMNALFELEHLIVASITSNGSRRRLGMLHRTSDFSTDDSGAGNLRAKPLEEAIDNVKERRAQPIPSPSSPSARMHTAHLNPETRSIMSTSPSSTNTDAIVTVLQTLFRDPRIRPKTLFRDLQFIASLVPSTVLDTERGKAFWDCGQAALVLKKEVCMTMVEVADEVVGTVMGTRREIPIPASMPGPGSTASVSSTSSYSGYGPSTSGTQTAQSSSSDPVQAPPNPPTPPPPTTAYTLADAVRMYTITAKEGEPTPQRELALLILSNPELVDRTTLPLSKPREVFNPTIMEKYGGGATTSRSHGLPYHERIAAGAGASLGRPGTSGSSSSAGGKASSGIESVRTEPALMAVAYHWMRAADQGGDDVARSYVQQQKELNGLG